MADGLARLKATLGKPDTEQAEIYVFTNGEGTMQVGDEMFPVRKDMALYIPPNALHSATNEASSAEPLTWVSLGLR